MLGAAAGGGGAEPLVDPSCWEQVAPGWTDVLFFFQYLLQAGLFFVVPLFLSVALGLSAVDTGLRILPLSLTLLVAAVGIPRFSHTPRLGEWCGWGSCPCLRGWCCCSPALDLGAGAEVVTLPLLLAGLGYRRAGVPARAA